MKRKKLLDGLLLGALHFIVEGDYAIVLTRDRVVLVDPRRVSQDTEEFNLSGLRLLDHRRIGSWTSMLATLVRNAMPLRADDVKHGKTTAEERRADDQFLAVNPFNLPAGEG